MIRLIGLILLFAPCVVSDILRQKIPALYVGLFSTAALIYNLITGEPPFWSMLAGIFYGALFIGFSFLTKGGIGMGDGLLIAAVGTLSGLKVAFSGSFAAFLLAALFGLFVMWIRKTGRKHPLPFAPFLAGAAITVQLFLILGILV